ncbi:hypothetical protein MTO96_015119 [Rhipicephalus appendiculatus]
MSRGSFVGFIRKVCYADQACVVLEVFIASSLFDYVSSMLDRKRKNYNSRMWHVRSSSPRDCSGRTLRLDSLFPYPPFGDDGSYEVRKDRASRVYGSHSAKVDSRHAGQLTAPPRVPRRTRLYATTLVAA